MQYLYQVFGTDLILLVYRPFWRSKCVTWNLKATVTIDSVVMRKSLYPVTLEMSSRYFITAMIH